MALANLTTTEAYAETEWLAAESLEKLNRALTEQTGTSSMVVDAIVRLNMYIKELEKQEQKILNAFGVKDEQELQTLFSNYYNSSGLIKLSGSDLEQVFLKKYRISVNENMKEMQEYIEKNFRKPIEEKLKTRGAEATKEAIAKEFNEMLNNDIITLDLMSGRVAKTSSSKPISINKSGIFHILADELTPAQKDRILLLKEHAKTCGDPKITSKTQITDNSFSIFLRSEWYELTRKGRTASEIEEMLKTKKISQKQFNDANRQIKRMIMNQTNNPKIVGKYIDMMLRQEPYMFFVGGNTNDITGLLGEIGGVIAVSELLKNVDSNKIVTWVANHKIKEKKLSIDILLKDIGNIQVKNTSKDLINIPEIDVSFAKGNVDFLIKKMEDGYGWSAEAIESILESESFNVPAKPLHNGKFEEVDIETTFKDDPPEDWELFTKTYNSMQQIIKDTHTFLSAYAPDFLYMSGPLNFKNQLATLDSSLEGFVGTGIHLYLVGGMPHLASSELKIIKKDLVNLRFLKEAENHFSIKSRLGTYGKEKLPRNYVAYKNDNIKPQKVKITSSYVFTN